MKLKQAIVKRIKEIIKDKKISQYELCKRTGVPQSTLSTIFNTDLKTIKLSTLFDLCAGLQIEFSDFFDCDYLKFKNLED